MINLLKSSWALFFGVGMIMLANGLQGSLISIRASLEGYSSFSTGIIMTAYYVGFLIGAKIIPQKISEVGHVRMFAALASVASISILLHSLHIGFITWIILRLITGFCFVGLFTVAESWINDSTDNEHRGQALSVYMIVGMAGNSIGHLLLNISDPQLATQFMVVSILISISLVPILITVSKQPDFSVTEFLSVKQLYIASPLGVIAAIIVGACHGALWGAGAVYGLNAGLDLQKISIFMFTFVSGGAIFQYYIGYLSDKYDRRIIITYVSFFSSLLCIFAIIFNFGFIYLIVITFVFGGLTVPLYSLAIAHTNDFLTKSEMVAASGGLLLVGGIGLAFGPIVSGLFMDILGANGFWIYLFISHAAIGIFALYRISIRDSVPLEEQGSAVLINSRMSPVAMELYPDAEESADTEN